MKAEERALEVYPDIYTRYRVIGDPEGVKSGISHSPIKRDLERKCYQEGYEQAEKDLALTWKDIKIIVKILADSDWYDFEVNGKLWSKEFYEEVLKRFEEVKK